MINIHEKFILQLEEELQQIKFILIVIINICIYIYQNLKLNLSRLEIYNCITSSHSS